MSDYIYERAQAIHKERKDIPSELLKMAETIDSESLPLDPNAYTLALYDGFFRLWTRYGAEAERERIIALIENSVRDCKCVTVGITSCRHNWTQTELVELIKGDETRIVQDNDATYIKGENK